MRRLLAVLAFTALSACNSIDGPLVYTVDGTWSGTSAGQTLVLNLSQGGTSVVGTGTLSGSSTTTRSLTVSGDFGSPRLTATLSSAVGQPISLIGTISGESTLVGSLNGAGFINAAITMTRQ